MQINKNQKLSKPISPPSTRTLDVKVEAARRGSVRGNKTRGKIYSLACSIEATTESNVPIAINPSETIAESKNSFNDKTKLRLEKNTAVDVIMTAEITRHMIKLLKNLALNIVPAETPVSSTP